MSKALTDKEKARLFAGRDNWTTMDYPDAGLPSIRMSDGPNGLRIEKKEGLGFNESHPSTLYPTASLSACSFDPDLQYELGQHLADEAIEGGVQILLGPGVNHKRSPLCGRNFEYYSEDPYLSGQLASAYVRGVQDTGIGVSLKHFAANSREYGRMVQDSVVDERALHELYLAQFETVVRSSHPATIMCAYNRLNGTYCCQNKSLMDEARSWGFDGAFISDWGAVADPAASLAGGLNLEMPGGDHYSDRRILKALKDHVITEHDLDENVERIRRLVEDTSICHRPALAMDHLSFARKAAEQSAVLLSNNGILPLAGNTSIALIGVFARTPRIQGTGSSKVNALETDCLFDVMKQNRAVFSYAPGFTLDSEDVDERMEEQALSIAERSSIVIFCTGLPEGREAEGHDRKDMRLPDNQHHLMRRLLRVNRNIIVILQCGSPVELPWRNEAAAILCMYLSGAKGGEACWNLLTGAVNPSGKLAETWPAALHDTPCFDTFSDHLLQVQYRESIFSGYRWYDAAGIEPAYPFGHGLSYTSFEYRNLQVRREENCVHADVDIINTGTAAGSETVQIYIGMKNSRIARAQKELKAFRKIFLQPGEKRTVSFELDGRCFSYYDTSLHDWRIETGTYRILAGASSRDIRLEQQIVLSSFSEPHSSIPPDYVTTAVDTHEFSREKFEAVLGRRIPSLNPGRPFTVNTSFHELQESGMGRLIKKGFDLVRSHKQYPGITDEMIMEVPIRSALMVSKRVTWDTVDAIRDLFNGKSTFLDVLWTLRRKL